MPPLPHNGKLLYPEAGVSQGSCLSPLLANVALHGLEDYASLGLTQRTNIQAPRLIRYADDLIVLHADLDIIKQVKLKLELWLAEMGLRFKASKTSISHTLEYHEGNRYGNDSGKIRHSAFKRLLDSHKSALWAA